MSAAATVLLYSGEQFDQRVQMQYLRARFYDAANGRLVGLDPVFGYLRDPQSFHKYLYVHANPINGIDPSGREFSAIGMTSVSSIGGFLNNLTGEVGHNVMNGLYHRQMVDWNGFYFGIGLAALGPLAAVVQFSFGAFKNISAWIRLPSTTMGHWTGARGLSDFIPNIGPISGFFGPISVRFRNMFPDFSPFIHVLATGAGAVKAETKIVLNTSQVTRSGRTTADFVDADKWLARQMGWFTSGGLPDAVAGKSYRVANNLVWHHAEDIGKMQLIPEILHDAVQHTGGRSLLDRALSLLD